MKGWPTVTIVTFCAAAATAVAASPRPAPRTLDRLTRADLPDAVAKASGKVSSRLRAAEGWLGPRAGQLAPAGPPRSADGTLEVYVDCSPLGAEQLAALARAGVEVEGIERNRGRIRGRLDAGALDRVAAFSWVHAVRAVDRAVIRAGGVQTEGDAAARADLVRVQGLDGSGVVVGVISDGIDALRDAQQSDDLPAVEVPSGCRPGAGNEGTALLEIVHDVAPGARLLFAGPADSFEMVEAVECLTAAGADVIVDDLGFFGEPYFEDGPVAAAVRAAVQAGVSYHSSAGNEAEEHLEQDFFEGAGVHDFAQGTGDSTNTLIVPAGGTLTCILQWNDPFGGSSNDYDLFLLDQNLNALALSTDPQNGAEDPIEVVEAVNQSAEDAVAHLVIDRFRGDARRLELFCLGASALEHTTAAGSIVGHPALDEVVAVAAIDAADPGLDQVEPFSSQGPARIDFPAPAERAKPDLAGFDGVAISNAGGFPFCPPACAFFGTSAASPHTAGVAALLLQKDPSLTPAAVQSALREGAVDIGSAGFDDASGFGRLDALAASEAVAAPQCTGDGDCDDADPCTVDVCDPGRVCVSTPLGGPDGIACRLGQLGASDVCRADEIDARTAAAIATRVGSALALLDRASQVSDRTRRKLFGKLVRQLGSLRRRVSRAAARDRIPAGCAATLLDLVESAQAFARSLGG